MKKLPAITFENIPPDDTNRIMREINIWCRENGLIFQGEILRRIPPINTTAPDGRDMLQKDIQYFGSPATVVCDENCKKAWGGIDRPKAYNIFGEYKRLSDAQVNDLSMRKGFDIDDWAYLADDELGTAPDNPGTYEGGESKPTDDLYKLNKWCVRACERSETFDRNEDFELRNLSKRFYNGHPHERD